MTRPTTAELLKYFLYLGSFGFGGPVATRGPIVKVPEPLLTAAGAVAGLVIFAVR